MVNLNKSNVFECASAILGAKLVLKVINDEEITKEEIEITRKQLKLLEKLAKIKWVCCEMIEELNKGEKQNE